MEITALQGQSIFDIAIQHSGNIEAVISIAMANDVSVTDKIRPGEKMNIPALIDRRVLNYYRINNIIPATTINDGLLEKERIFDNTFDSTFE